MDDELRRIARSLVWWKPPESVDETYLLRRVMDLGTPAMVRLIRNRFGEEKMRQALTGAEPGNFSAPSWNYWHLVFGLRPTPPLPQRNAPDTPHVSAVLQRAVDTFVIEAEGPRGGVKLSFFGGISHGQVRPPDVAEDNRLKVASAEDLLALKLGTIQQRVEAKDYLDICALLRSGLSLEPALGHLEALHPLITNSLITLKTLVYFSGGDLATLPEDVKRDLEEAVRRVREPLPFVGPKTEIGSGG